MARRNITILGINALKWTDMGEFNSDDHYIYYCGQESQVNIKTILIIFFAPKYRETLYIQSNQDLELTVAQISFLLQS